MSQLVFLTAIFLLLLQILPVRDQTTQTTPEQFTGSGPTTPWSTVSSTFFTVSSITGATLSADAMNKGKKRRIVATPSTEGTTSTTLTAPTTTSSTTMSTTSMTTWVPWIRNDIDESTPTARTTTEASSTSVEVSDDSAPKVGPETRMGGDREEQVIVEDDQTTDSETETENENTLLTAANDPEGLMNNQEQNNGPDSAVAVLKPLCLLICVTVILFCIVNQQ